MNKIIVSANLTKDPELRFIPQSGTAVCKFSGANNEGYGEKKITNFLNFVAWGKTAELISNYTHKGSKVLVEGRIQTGNYEKDGKKVYTTDIVVEKIEFLDKKEGQAKQDDDVFTPTDDDPFQPTDEDIPF